MNNLGDAPLLLRVSVFEGRHFPLGQHPECVECVVSFGGDVKTTGYSVGKASHLWNATCVWRTSRNQLRALSLAGHHTVKLTCQAKVKETINQLGWAVLDLRSAKFNNQFASESGSWITLNSSKTGIEGPQLRVYHCLAEEMLPSSDNIVANIEQENSPVDSKVEIQPTGQPAGTSTPAPPHKSKSPSERSYTDPKASSAGTPMSYSTVSHDSMPQPVFVPDDAHVAPAPVVAQPAPPPSKPPSSMQPSDDDGPTREFSLAVDLLTFQAGMRLPLNVARTYVQAMLPPDVLELVVRSGRRLPSSMAPLKTQPAVDIARGSEGALPNGHGSIAFAVSVMHLARVLARDPRVNVEVWRKEEARSDSLLGVASVPLSPLLQNAWVDGYAPVYALMAPAPPKMRENQQSRKVEVGMLRVAISLKDHGPAGPAAQPSAPPVAHPAVPAVAPDVPVLAPIPAAPPSNQQPLQPASVISPEVVQQLLPAAPVAGPASSAIVPAAITPVQELPEYQAAYELEMWRKGEESRWRQELREREAARMSVLEGEWRRREAAREAEVAAVKTEYAALEERTRQVLAAAEDRERRVVAAEEAVGRRRRDMEREHASRMAEAEAAVRRLQVECEHQLEMERDRNTELARQRSALEERLAVSEARSASMEQAFAVYREQVRGTNEAALQRELLELRDALRRSEERAAKALKAKAAYKDQVIRLAEQLASLYKAHQHLNLQAQQQQQAQAQHVLPLLDPSRAGNLLPHSLLPAFPAGAAGMRGGSAGGAAGDSGALQLAAEEQARFAVSQQQELAALRQQLQALKNSALASVSPQGSPQKGQQQQQQGNEGAGGAQGDVRSVPDQRPRQQQPVAAAGAAGRGAAPTPSQQQLNSQQQLQAAAPGAAAAAAALDTPTKSRPSPGGAGAFERPDASSSRQAAYAAAAEAAAVGIASPTRHNASVARAAITNTATPKGAPPPQQQQPQEEVPAQPAQPHAQQDQAAVPAPAVQHDQAAAAQAQLPEIRRLLARKSELLGTGAYARDDPLIVRIEQRIQQLAGLPAGAQAQ